MQAPSASASSSSLDSMSMSIGDGGRELAIESASSASCLGMI